MSRVVIAGGGVAGIEAAVALNALAGDRCRVDLYSPRSEFAYRPNAVEELFDVATVHHYELPDLVERIGGHFHLEGIAAVDAAAGKATTESGEVLDFDYLIAASGVHSTPAVPGAITFWGVGDQETREVFNDLLEGKIKGLALTAPGPGSWDLPLYELALLAESRLPDELKETTRLIIVTPEERPLRVFGRPVSEAIAKLLAARGIETVLATHAVEFDGSNLTTVPAGKIEVDAVVTLPRLAGKFIEGLPHDDEGFIPIDDHCQVLRTENVFAIGDVTSFPVKQGGVATQQADVAATVIAARVGAAVEPLTFDPVLRGVLYTGEGNLYLEGWLSGGHGESSVLTTTRPWRGDDSKIVGKYLTPFLAGDPLPKA